MKIVSKYIVAGFTFLLMLIPLSMQGQSVNVKGVRMVTGPEKNHFFGYYGINPWNADKTHILSLEVDNNDRLASKGEKAVIGLVDIRSGKFSPLTETRAWNLQQGCMFFWNPENPNTEFYFNDMVDDRLVSVLFNIETGNRKVIPNTISGLSHDGSKAVHMNYGRISRLRKVVSYSGTVDENPHIAHPENDGIFIVDLKTGSKKLLISYAEMAREISVYAPEILDRHIWVEHAEFNRSDNKILFLPRTVDSTGLKLETGLYTINLDGSGLKMVVPYGASVSHFGWRNDHQIVVTFNHDGNGRRHVLVNDEGFDYHTIGDMKWDGHCSFDKSGQWILSDGCKDNKNQRNSVWMYHMPSATTHLIHTLDFVDGRFLAGDTRCDLHPRISDDNTMICVDGIDPATLRRQIYIIDISVDTTMVTVRNAKIKKQKP